jgi:hypothetical protein
MIPRKLLHSVAVSVLILWLALGDLRAGAQIIDLQASRLQITAIATNWRFHPGDDPLWAQPGFDDSSWKLMQPTSDWVDQGYSEQNGLAWFRFRLRVPPQTSSFVLELPEIQRSYQLFANGVLLGQVGGLPPEHPHAVLSAPRLFTVPVHPSGNPQVITLALRLWQEPRLKAVTDNVLRHQAYAGDAGDVSSRFSLLKAATLLRSGGDYTLDILMMIMGAATLLLFWLTREGFYLWFAVNMVLAVTDLPIHLLSHHFAWGYLFTLYAYILLDFVSGLSFVLFLLGMLNRSSTRTILIFLCLSLAPEVGPLLVTTGYASASWGSLIYFVAQAVIDLILLWYMVSGWRAGSVYAKLLLVPYAIEVLFQGSTNLGYVLVDLNIPHGESLITDQIQLLQEPFSISLMDVGSIASLLGLLAVLVYRFARTSRDQQRLSAALQAAHDVQSRLVPVDLPVLGGLRAEIAYLAAEEVGGDFCQVLPRPDGSILVAIGDVSGKGLQAAMLGTLAVGALRSIADEDLEPAAALERLNNVILRTGQEGFITCLCLKLAPDGVITVANAGHLAPYLDGEEMMVEPGLPLGIVPAIEYEQSTLVLPGTARLTLISDGVVEARSRSGELFGFERTTEISRLAAAEIASAAQRFGQQDDITIITLDWVQPVAELISA